MDITGYTYKLISTYIKNEVEEVKNVDLFFDQFNEANEGNVTMTANPTVLIELEPIEFVKMFGGVQNAVASVTLHIGIDMFNSLIEENEDKNIAYLSLLTTIYQKLSGISSYNLPQELKSDVFILNNVERSGMESATNTGSIKVSTITFDITLEDHSALIDSSTVGEIDTIDLQTSFIVL